MAAQRDSLPAVYNGYRLHLTGIEVVKKEDENIKIRYTAINTGRESLDFGKGFQQEVQILFDQSLENAQLMAYEHRIRASIFEQELKIPAGKIKSGQEMKFSTADVFAARGTSGVEKEPVHEPAPPEPAGERLCADLSIEEVKVVKSSKRSVTISYTLKNNGEGVADLTGPDRKDYDNVAIRVSMSHADRITRSSMILGGSYIKDKSKPKLAPGQQYTGTIKLDISKMTKYTPYLVLELDAHDVVEECDETNNRGAVKVR